MAELKELFEMTTKQMEPDQDSWQEQQRRQRRRGRARRVGALAVAAAIVVVAIVVVASNVGPEEAPSIATQPPPTPAAGSRFLDLRTGETTPLPESVAGGVSAVVSPTARCSRTTRVAIRLSGFPWRTSTGRTRRP